MDSGDPAVGLLLGASPGCEICTGTLISGTYVLTARHCLANGVVAFYTGAGKPTQDFCAPSIQNMTRHEVDPSGQRTHGTLDLGLVRLRSPLPITPSSYGGAAPAAGTICQSVGFGRTASSSQATHGQKRWANEQVVSAYGSMITTKWRSGLADHGDSGGPLYCGSSVVGVASQTNDFEEEVMMDATKRREIYVLVQSAKAWVDASTCAKATCLPGVFKDPGYGQTNEACGGGKVFQCINPCGDAAQANGDNPMWRLLPGRTC